MKRSHAMMQSTNGKGKEKKKDSTKPGESIDAANALLSLQFLKEEEEKHSEMEKKYGVDIWKCDEVMFLNKLHNSISQNGIDAICWRPHGKSFFIQNEKKFVKDVLPSLGLNFTLDSFYSCLKDWGFKKIVESSHCFSLYHVLFQRDNKHLLLKMLYNEKIKKGDMNNEAFLTALSSQLRHHYLHSNTTNRNKCLKRINGERQMISSSSPTAYRIQSNMSQNHPGTGSKSQSNIIQAAYDALKKSL